MLRRRPRHTLRYRREAGVEKEESVAAPPLSGYCRFSACRGRARPQLGLLSDRLPRLNRQRNTAGTRDSHRHTIVPFKTTTSKAREKARPTAPPRPTPTRPYSALALMMRGNSSVSVNVMVSGMPRFEW